MAVTSDPRPRGRAVTLTDVARLAGVSVATASKALNGRAQVAPATRARVTDAAERLQFSPNALARSLLAGRTGTVGLLTSDLVGRFSIPILMGAEDALGAGRSSVLLCDARGDAIREQHHVRSLLSQRVDGLIVVGDRTEPRASLGTLPVPVVYAYAPSQDPADHSIVADNVGGARLAIEHLIAIGRRRIGHISGDPTYGAATDRTRGVTDTLAEAGLEPAGGRALYGAWSEAWGRSATRLLLDRAPDVDAIFAGSDQIARGVLDALHELGKRVPEEVAVVGYDNWEVLAASSRPPLTSVDINLETLGRLAAERLSHAIEGRTAPGLDVVPGRLVVRASTMPLS